MPASPFRLITLDLDDTLWPCLPVIQAAEDAVHAWLHRQAPRLAEQHDVPSMRRHRGALMERAPEIAHDLGLVRRRSLEALLETHGYPPQLADTAMDIFMEYRNRVEPYADVIPVLTVLAERYALVSVTNGNASVAATPLRGLFRHSLTAAEAGAAKPAPAIFQRALALTGCRPDECLHLGDDPWRDVEAARAIGLAAAWVNRNDAAWPDGLAPPTLTVTDLHAVAAWLDGGNNGDTHGF